MSDDGSQRGPASTYAIRPLRTPDEYGAAVQLQRDTWGPDFSEIVPLAILKVAQILGGVVSGAFAEDGSLDGFVFGMTGERDGKLVHWSDMLAVRPGARDSGLGTHLKRHQRSEVMARGVSIMHWTFDPLQARNAHLNVNRLGAVMRDYAADLYGESDSPLHRGIGTDRLVATWELDSPRVERRLGRFRETAEYGSASGGAPIQALSSIEGEGGLPRPSTGLSEETLSRIARESPGGPVSVEIPTHLTAIMEASMELAREWRRATRAVLSPLVDSGFEVTGFVRGTPTCRYLLTTGATPSLLKGSL